MSWGDQFAMRFDNAGALVLGPRTSKRIVVGPASYAADGIPVDLSAVFSSLSGITIRRAYVTATGVADTRTYEINEVGTDTFANRKFRIKVFRTPTPVGTNGAPGTTTDVNVIKATGTVANASVQDTAGLCIVGCDGDHITGEIIDGIQGSGASKVTVLTSVSAPSFTGTAPTTTKTEIDATTDLSTISIEFLAEGVPA